MKKRVTIPVHNPTALLELAKRVQAKHVADGDASLLKAARWSEAIPVIEAAVSNHEKAARLKREMLEAFQQRDIQLETIISALRDGRDILAGAYKKEMKVLGQWGYEVLDVRSKAAQTKSVDAGAKV